MSGGVSIFTPKNLNAAMPPFPFVEYFKKSKLTPTGEVVEDLIDKNPNLSEQEKRTYKRKLREE